MSDKTAKKVNRLGKHKFSGAYKWGIAILAVILIEAISIFVSIKIIDVRSNNRYSDLVMLRQTAQSQQSRLDDLERLPNNINKNAQRIAENLSELNILKENLRQLYEEVGNNQIEQLGLKVVDLDKRILLMEEEKSNESLILSVALLIKENILYHRSFSYELSVLSELAESQPDIAMQLEILKNTDTKNLVSAQSLINTYHSFIKDFKFKTDDESDVLPHEQSKFSKSIDVIKDTISGIKFDKLVVVRNSSNNQEDKNTILNLTKAVDSNNFAEALNIIEQNPKFNEADNHLFNEWLNLLKQKNNVDMAISQIIATELKFIRSHLENVQNIPSQGE